MQWLLMRLKSINSCWRYLRILPILVFLLSSVSVLQNVSTVSAHGTEIELNEVAAVEILARFDNGDPMADAQVAIYAPTDQTTPWLTGQADANGQFVFVPDRSLTGQWDVQLRTAGHGDWVYIDIAEGDIAGLTGSGGGLTTAQIALMSAAIIWGFIGTAFYFMGGNKEADTPDDEVVRSS